MATVRVGDAEVALKLTGDDAFEQNLTRSVAKAIADARREADNFFSDLNGKNIVINITADAAKVASEIDDATRTRTATVDVVADAAQAASEIATATADQDVTVAVIADAAQASAEIQDATADQDVQLSLFADVTQAAAEISDVAVDRDMTITAIADVAEAQAAIDDLTQAQEVDVTAAVDQSQARDAMGKFSQTAKKGGEDSGLAAAAAFGGKFTGALAAVGIGKFLVDGFSQYGEFESKGKELGVVLGLNADQSKALATQAKQLGLDTRFASISAADAANAQLELAKGGVDLTKSMDATQSALLLAEAGEIDAGKAAEVSAVQINSFKLSNKDLAAVADDLVGAANASSASVTDIAESSKFAAPAFALLQKDTLGSKGAFEEMNVVLAGLATQGLKGSLAGTGLRGAMLALVNPSKLATDQIDGLNQTFAASQAPAEYAANVKRLSAQVSGMSFDSARAQLGKLNSDLATKDPKAFNEQMTLLSNVLTEQLGSKGPKIQKAFSTLRAGYAEANPAAFSTAFQNALAGIDGASETMQKKLKNGDATFKELGFSVDGVAAKVGSTGDLFIDTTGKMRPMTEILPRLAKSLEGLSSSDKAKKLDQIFGSVGGTTIAAALNITKGQFDDIRTAVLRQGQAADLAKAKNSGLKGAFSSLQSTIETAQLTLAEKLAPVLGDLIRKVTTFIPVIQDFIIHFVDLIQHSEALRITVAAVAGVLLIMAAPIVSIIAGITALIIILKRAYDTNEDFRKTIDGIVAKLKTFIPIIIEVATNLKDIFLDALAIVQALWKKWGDDIVNILESTVSTIVGVIQGVVQVIKGIFELIKAIVTGNWGEAWQAVKDILSGVVTVIVSALTGFWDQTKFLFKVGTDALLAVWHAFWDVIGPPVTAAFEAVKGFVTTAFNDITGFFKAVAKTLGDIWDGFWRGLAGIFSAAWDFVYDTASAAIGKLVDIFDAVKAGFIAAWRALWNFLQAALGDIWSSIVNAIHDVMKIGSDFFAFVKDAFVNGWKTLWHFLEDALAGIWTSIVGAIKSTVSFASDIFSGAVGGLKAAWSALFDTLKDGIGAIWSGIQGAVKAAVNFGADIFDGAKKSLGDAWRAVWGELRAIFADLFNGAGGIVDFIERTFSGIADGVGHALDAIPGVIKAAFRGVKDAIATIMNPIIDGLNATIHGINDINPFSDIKTIPHLAAGGVAFARQMAIVGENGPEPFVPAVNGRVVSNSEARQVLADTFRMSVSRGDNTNTRKESPQVQYAPQYAISGVSADQVIAEVEARDSSILAAILSVLT